MSTIIPSHEVFCTSLFCAATIGTLGGIPKKEDFITVEKIPGGENIQYRWHPITENGENVIDLISAYSVMSRGGHPTQAAIKILNNEKHAIHICYSVLNHRDRLHSRITSRLFDSSLDPVLFCTKDIKIAASLCALSSKEKSAFQNGKEVFFGFDSSEKILELHISYQMAWNKMVLPREHPIYFCKSVLDKRGEFINYIKKAKEVAFVKIKDGGRFLLARVKTDPELIKKALKY